MIIVFTQYPEIFQLSAVVDGVYADHSHIAGKFNMLSSSKVYVGGSINTRALPGARVHNNFVGCMRKVSTFLFNFEQVEIKNNNYYFKKLQAFAVPKFFIFVRKQV